MKIVITHVKNERYLLNWWLMHHKDKFDHGIILDYASTDGSMELVKLHTPTWEVIQSRNKTFNADALDLEVYDIERAIQAKYPGAWMVALTAAEFLIGDTRKLNHLNYHANLYIKCDHMVDPFELMYKEPDPNSSLVQQRTFGIPLEFNETTRYNPGTCSIGQRKMRSMHNYNYNYMEKMGTGRHIWWTHPTDDFRILWYGLSPFTNSYIARKLAIQYTIPPEDKAIGLGGHHFIDCKALLARLELHQKYGLTDLGPMIENLEAQ